MNKILQGTKSLYIDSNILIYLIEGNQTVSDLVLSAFSEINEFDIDLVTSEITLMECLNGAFRTDNQELATKYEELFSESNFVTLIPVDKDILIEAARTASQKRLKTVDAIHFSTAQYYGCDGFLTNDKAFHSSNEVRVIQLSEFKG